MTAADSKGRKCNITADGEHIIIPPESIANDAEYIEISDSEFCARAGDEGCYIIADVEYRRRHCFSAAQGRPQLYNTSADIIFCRLGNLTYIDQRQKDCPLKIPYHYLPCGYGILKTKRRRRAAELSLS